MIQRIHTLRALKDNFIYLLTAGDGRCAVIDPGESAPVADFLSREKLKLTHILCTHHHHDHIGGAAELAEEWRCEVWSSQFDRDRVPAVTDTLSEKGNYKLFDEELRILDVPGHTLGQIALYFPRLEALFVGDTLFSAGCGRLFEGTHEQMFSSLAKISALPPQTKIYFGHEYTIKNLQFVMENGDNREPVIQYQKKVAEQIAAGEDTTPTFLATELGINPFLRAKTVEEFRRWREMRNVWQ